MRIRVHTDTLKYTQKQGNLCRETGRLNFPFEIRNIDFVGLNSAWSKYLERIAQLGDIEGRRSMVAIGLSRTSPANEMARSALSD